MPKTTLLELSEAVCVSMMMHSEAIAHGYDPRTVIMGGALTAISAVSLGCELGEFTPRQLDELRLRLMDVLDKETQKYVIEVKTFQKN